MIPAGLATFSVVFVGLQTSILCFPCVIFISRFDSKQDIYQTILYKVKARNSMINAYSN